MKLLETYPQDIKATRDFKPCAPGMFRWLVLGGYAAILVVTAVFFVAQLQASHLEGAKKSALEKVTQKSAELEEVRSRGSAAAQAKTRYESMQNWLRDNYSLTPFLATLFKALPQEVRLQELTLEENGGGRLLMNVKLFPPTGGRLPSFEEFITRLEAQGLGLEDRQQAAENNLELSATFSLPREYFPARKDSAPPQQKAEGQP